MNRGVLAKAYRNTGTFANAAWNEVPLFDDLTINPTWGTSPANARDSQVSAEAPALATWGITGTIKVLKDDADYLAVKSAHLAGTPFDMMFLTGPNNTNNESGFRCEWLVKSMSQDQGTGVGQLYDSVEFVPHGHSTNKRQSVLVTNTAPVFTDF